MPLRPPNMHAVFPRENLDLAAFVVAFAFGVAGILFLKIYVPDPYSAIVAAVYSVVILVAYACVARVVGRVKVEPETIGDNCYYLGFLFTLVSLSFTLYQLADPSANDGKPVSIPDVISGFGVALSSTIAGVFLRVLMMQMRTDFVAKDREIRADVNRSYANFRKTLSGTLSQMKAFSVESVQKAAERDRRLRIATERFVTDHQNALQETADTLAGNMERSFSLMAEKSVKHIADSVKESNRESQAAIQELVEDVQKLKSRLSEQDVRSLDEFRNLHERRVAELEAAEKRMKDHDAAMEEYIKGLRERRAAELEAAEKRMKDHDAATEEYTRNLRERRAAELEAAEKRMKDHDIAMEEYTRNLRERRAVELEAAEKRMKDHDAAMEKYIEVTRNTADAMTRHVVPALDTLKERLDRLPADVPSAPSGPGPTRDDPENPENAVGEPFSRGEGYGPWNVRKGSDA